MPANYPELDFKNCFKKFRVGWLVGWLVGWMGWWVGLLDI